MIVMDKMNKTRQLILDIAKQIFLEKGYSPATFQMIADKAKISKTSINYYYAKKKDISNEILSNHLRICNKFVFEHIDGDDLLRSIVTSIVFLKSILKTPQGESFLRSVVSRNDKNVYPAIDFNGQYISVIYFLNLNISPKDFEIKKISLFGMLKELSSAYLSGTLNISQDEYITAVINDVLSVLMVSCHIIDLYCKKGFDIYNNIDQQIIPKF